MSDARNALLSRDSHLWSLRMALVFCALIIFALIAVLGSRLKDIDIHIPPDLSKGATVRPGVLEKASAYAFANYVWKGVNTWTNSGKDEYEKLIEAHKCHVTPEFKNWLERNRAQKIKNGELDRVRFVSDEVVYDPNFVTDKGNNVMSVAMVMRLQEFVGGMRIKNIVMNYSLNIVHDSRSCNEMHMAIDGFNVDPTRAEKDAEDKSRTVRAQQ